jgi:uncharacterized protein
MAAQHLNTRAEISDFLSQRELALIGISRAGRKFGNTVRRELTAKGYRVHPVHPQAQEIDGQRCWPSVLELPVKVGGVVIVVPPSETEKVLRDVLKARIPRVWMQQASDSPAAIRFCQENGIEVVHGACILMFAEPLTFLHRLHHWICGLLGKLPV